MNQAAALPDLLKCWCGFSKLAF